MAQIALPNNCHMSEPKVMPANWRTGGPALMLKKWRIYYRFYDPSQAGTKGLLIRVNGMNAATTLKDRREITWALIADIIQSHIDGYNPILKKFTEDEPDPEEAEIPPSTPLVQALRAALEKITCEKRTKTDVKNALTYIVKSIQSLRYDRLKISAVSRKHIRAILDNCEKVKPYFSNNQFNNYRKYLSMLFAELMELEAALYNPVRDVKKRQTVKKIRPTLTDQERVRINDYLQTAYPDFHRYMLIFYHSGRRTTELLRLRYEDVDLANQRFIITERKGNRHFEKWCAIKTIAVPLWAQAISKCLPGQYLFGDGLVGADKPINADQITKRWNKHVKKHLGINKDFYSLKHSNADDIAKKHGIDVSRRFIGHTTESTTRIYATGQSSRDLDVLKGLDNEFV